MAKKNPCYLGGIFGLVGVLRGGLGWRMDDALSQEDDRDTGKDESAELKT